MQETEVLVEQAQIFPEVRKSSLRRVKYDLVLVLMTFIWGGTFLVVKETLKLVEPFTYLGLCYAVATLTLVLIFHRRLVHITRSQLFGGVLIGVVLFAGYAFQTLGLQLTTVSKAGFITGLYVPMVPFFALILLRQRIPGVALIGIVLSVLGLFLLSLNGQFNLVFGRGEWLLLGCAVTFALQVVLVGKFAPQGDAISLAIIQLAVTSVLSLLAVPLTHEPIVPPPAISWLPMIFMGTCDMAFTLLAMNWVQQFVSSTRAALVYALEPMWAALFGFLIAGDRLSLAAGIGCLCIFCGMIIGRLDNFNLRKREHA